MFTPGRYMVVDDELSELRILVDALHGIGAPCVGVHYTGRPLDPARFAGVRVLFCDLHLVPTGGDTAQYAAIEALLRSNVNPAIGGPYLLILWTKHEEKISELRAFLQGRLEPAKKPIAILCLDKAVYLSPQGEISKPEELVAAITDRISGSPQLRALISWEADVLAAAGATLAEIGDLVPLDQRDHASFSNGLDGVLSRLAVAAVGAPNVERDRRAAINTALAPILADRIINAPARPQEQGVWDRAITRQKEMAPFDAVQIGRMNRLLHLSMPPAELVGPTDWGAVLLLPEPEREDAAMKERFGIGYNTLLHDIFRIERKERPGCTPVLIRIGAVCDYAQHKPGPVPYVLGLLVPATTARRECAQPKSELENPIFLIDDERGPERLFVNARFQISLVQPPPTWTPLFRIREQALMMIAAHVAEYVTRPGVVKLPN